MQIFTHLKKCVWFVVLWLVVTNASAQQINVTGTVTSKEEGTLPGITVTLKGPTQGRATDAAGHYSISAKKGDVLIFTGVGYATSNVSVTGPVLNVVLEVKTNGLNEVVVIGYGTTTRQNITTAVTKVDPKTVPQAANNSIQQLLFGRAAGLQVTQSSSQPGGGINLSIRGRGEPLYVVDGVIFPSTGLEPGSGSIGGVNTGIIRGGLAGLNPDDVESIEVLKDASAAIYGVNAANGVVLITTKKGKSGNLRINYSGSHSFQKNYPYLQPLNATEYETLFNQFANDYTIGAKPKLYTPAQIAAAGEGTNWLNQVFKNGSIDNHQLNINGGSEKTTYYVSTGYYNEQGTLQHSGVQKITARANLQFNPVKYLSINTNFTGNSNEYNNSTSGGQNDGSGSQGYGTLQAAVAYLPTLPIQDAAGNYTRYGTIVNPVAINNLIQDRTYNHSVSANVSADVKIIPGMLAAHLLFGDNYEAANRDFFIPSTLYSYGLSQSRASQNYNNRENRTVEETITFKKDFGDAFNFDAVAGMGQYKSIYNAFGAQGAGAPDAFGTSALQSETSNLGITSGKSVTKTRSYFARATASFLDRYLLTGSFRYDGFSYFFPQSKYAAFPSVSAGWKIKNESFLKDVEKITQFKLRASYGTSGSTAGLGTAAYGAYASDGNILYFNNGGTSYATIVLTSLDHPDLTWQKTTNKNIGLDFGLFKDRITGSFDVFKDDITNLLRTTAPTAPLSFLSTQPANGGHQVRSGWDLNFNTRNIQTKDFTWNSIINFSHYTYKWVERFNYDILGASGGVTYQSATDPVNEIYYFKTNGILQPGQAVPASQPIASSGGARLPGAPIFVDANGDGKLTGADVFKLNPDPKIIIGFGNDFRYKQFDMSIFFYGRFGGMGYNPNYSWADPASLITGISNMTTLIYQNYSSSNPSGTRPGVNYNESSIGLPVGSDLGLTSTNFVRCRNITLGYTFSNKFFNSFSKSFRLFADVQNAFIITNFKGADPEATYYGVKGGFAPYPMYRTISFGLKAGF